MNSPENIFVKCIPPHTPLLYSKSGVYKGIPIFLNFDPKHRLWVLVKKPQSRNSLIWSGPTKVAPDAHGPPVDITSYPMPQKSLIV